MSTMENRMNQMTDSQAALDRMQYTKNNTSARLVLLAILFDVLFFVSIYQSDAGSFYYTQLIGASVIYNLIFLLAAFLAEEGVKNRKPRFSILLVVLGVIQILRIFILPMQAHSAEVTIAGVTSAVMGDTQFLLVIIYLIMSAVSCIAAGITSSIQNKKLSAYLNSMAEADRKVK